MVQQITYAPAIRQCLANKPRLILPVRSSPIVTKVPDSNNEAFYLSSFIRLSGTILKKGIESMDIPKYSADNRGYNYLSDYSLQT